MTLHLSNCQIKRKYLSGYSYTKVALRKHKYILTINGNDIFEDVFYSETLTKKKGEVWQNGETHYYFEVDKTMYKTKIELLKSKYEIVI